MTLSLFALFHLPVVIISHDLIISMFKLQKVNEVVLSLESANLLVYRSLSPKDRDLVSSHNAQVYNFLHVPKSMRLNVSSYGLIDHACSFPDLPLPR